MRGLLRRHSCWCVSGVLLIFVALAFGHWWPMRVGGTGHLALAGSGSHTPEAPRDPNRIVIVYQAVASLPAWVPEAGEIVATSQQQFQALLEQYRTDPDFIGTITVTDDPNPPGVWPPAYTGSAHLRIRFRDAGAYNTNWVAWLQGDWLPGYAYQQEVTPPPPVEEALFDLDLWSPIDPMMDLFTTWRVRASDGAVAVVSVQLLPHPYEVDPQPPGGEPTGGELRGGRLYPPCPKAGPYWPICCHTQNLFCRSLFGWLVCLFKPNAPCCVAGCSQCFLKCERCQVANPCHSCDPCGLSWLLCRLPGGGC